MNPLISVIIPVYNTKRYLDKCIQSILQQSYENYEVILVDDGSNDGSEKMCDEYALQYEIIRTFHISNGGPSIARNFGVNMAKGNYVSFVDADDLVTRDYLEYLYELFYRNSADISCTDLAEGAIDESNRKYKEEVINAENAIIRSCYNDHVSISPCGKLYKKNLLEQNPFPEGKIYEDLATIYKLFSCSNRIAISTKEIYIVVKRPGSIQRRTISEEQFDHLSASVDQIEFMSSHYPEAVEAAKYRCVSNALEMISRHDVLKCNNAKSYFKRIQAYIKKYARDVLGNRHTSNAARISILIVLLGYYPVRFFWPLREKIKQEWIG